MKKRKKKQLASAWRCHPVDSILSMMTSPSGQRHANDDGTSGQRHASDDVTQWTPSWQWWRHPVLPITSADAQPPWSGKSHRCGATPGVRLPYTTPCRTGTGARAPRSTCPIDIISYSICMLLCFLSCVIVLLRGWGGVVGVIQVIQRGKNQFMHLFNE